MKTFILTIIALFGMFGMATSAFADITLTTAPLTTLPGSVVSCKMANANSSIEAVTINLYRKRSGGRAGKIVKSKFVALLGHEGTALKLLNVGRKRWHWCEFIGDSDPDVAGAIQTQKGPNQNSESAEIRDTQP